MIDPAIMEAVRKALDEVKVPAHLKGTPRTKALVKGLSELTIPMLVTKNGRERVKRVRITKSVLALAAFLVIVDEWPPWRLAQKLRAREGNVIRLGLWPRDRKEGRP